MLWHLPHQHLSRLLFGGFGANAELCCFHLGHDSTILDVSSTHAQNSACVLGFGLVENCMLYHSIALLHALL